jgi:MFS transporter
VSTKVREREERSSLPAAGTEMPTSRAIQTGGLSRRYWWLWGATAVSSVGDGLVLVGFPLLAATMTHSALALSGLLAALKAPWLVCSLPFGAMADRGDRRRMAITIETARMAVLVAFAAAIGLGHDSLALLYATAFALGALETGFFAATISVVPELVSPDELSRANGHLYSARYSGEEFAGPALGGVVFAAAAALPFLLDGVSFAASAAMLLVVFGLWRRPRPGFSPAAPAAPPAAVARTTVWHDVVEGVRYLTGQPLLRLLAGVIASFAFCQAMVMGILVKYGLVDLHLSQAGYGLFLTIGAVGSITAGAIAGRVHRVLGTARLLMLSGVAAAIAYLAMSASSLLPVAGGALLLECLAVGWGNVCSLSLRQRVIPSELLGRTSNAFRMVVIGSVPVGALVGGVVGDAVSLRGAFALAGLVQLVIVLAAGRTLCERINAAEIDLREAEPVLDLGPTVSEALELAGIGAREEQP